MFLNLAKGPWYYEVQKQQLESVKANEYKQPNQQIEQNSSRAYS